MKQTYSVIVSVIGLLAIFMLFSCGDDFTSAQPRVDAFRIGSEVGYTGDLTLTFRGNTGQDATVKVFRAKLEEGEPELLIQREVIEPFTFAIEEDIIFMEPGKYELYGTVDVAEENFTTVERPVVTVLDEKTDVTDMQSVRLSDLRHDADELIVGRTYQLVVNWPINQIPTNKRVTWETKNEDVAVVDQKGMVSILAEGEAVIRAYSEEKPAIWRGIAITGVTSLEGPQIIQVITSSTGAQNISGVGNLATDVSFRLPVQEVEGGPDIDRFKVSFSFDASGISHKINYRVEAAHISMREMPAHPEKSTFWLDAGNYTLTLWAEMGSDITVPVRVWIDN